MIFEFIYEIIKPYEIIFIEFLKKSGLKFIPKNEFRIVLFKKRWNSLANRKTVQFAGTECLGIIAQHNIEQGSTASTGPNYIDDFLAHGLD